MSDFLTITTKPVPVNFGPLRGANGNARILGSCGDTMEFWVLVQEGIIEKASYTTDGCHFSNKCGSTTAAIVCGVSVEVAEQITQTDILSVVGEIDDESAHCALLSVNTLNAAITDFRSRDYK